MGFDAGLAEGSSNSRSRLLSPSLSLPSSSSYRSTFPSLDAAPLPRRGDLPPGASSDTDESLACGLPPFFPPAPPCTGDLYGSVASDSSPSASGGGRSARPDAPSPSDVRPPDGGGERPDSCLACGFLATLGSRRSSSESPPGCFLLGRAIGLNAPPPFLPGGGPSDSDVEPISMHSASPPVCRGVDRDPLSLAGSSARGRFLPEEPESSGLFPRLPIRAAGSASPAVPSSPSGRSGSRSSRSAGPSRGRFLFSMASSSPPPSPRALRLTSLK